VVIFLVGFQEYPEQEVNAIRVPEIIMARNGLKLKILNKMHEGFGLSVVRLQQEANHFNALFK
jgi:hypothetical protein